MAKESKGLHSLIKHIDEAVDKGINDEINMKEVNPKLFRGILNLTGKVKFHMEPMKKAEDRQGGDGNVSRK